MRGRFLYITLVLGIVALVGISAFLTSRMLDYSVPDPATRKIPKVPGKHNTGQPTVLDDTYVLLDGPEEPPTPVKLPADAAKIMPVPVSPSAKQNTTQYPAAPKDAEGIGRVSLLIGTATASTVDLKTRTLDGKSWILLNDTIETGTKSKLTIELNDGTTLSQGASCKMVIDEFLYKPEHPAEAGFAMRLIKGTCRMVTGFVTKINPDRFEVRTRMATIGIRGCDTAVSTSPVRDDIYIIGLSKKESVTIDAASNGAPIRAIQSGDSILTDKKLLTTVNISEPQTVVSILSGKGIEQRRMTRKDFRNVIDMTSTLPSAGFTIHQSADEAVIQLQEPKE